jgi:hypothetical protein
MRTIAVVANRAIHHPCASRINVQLVSAGGPPVRLGLVSGKRLVGNWAVAMAVMPPPRPQLRRRPLAASAGGQTYSSKAFVLPLTVTVDAALKSPPNPDSPNLLSWDAAASDAYAACLGPHEQGQPRPGVRCHVRTDAHNRPVPLKRALPAPDFWGHIGATNDQTAADNSGHQEARISPAHRANLRPGRTMYRWRPLRTARLRRGCGPNVDQAYCCCGGTPALFRRTSDVPPGASRWPRGR